MAELARLREARTQDEWVFEGAKRGRPLAEPKSALERIAAETRLRPFSLHGIRHAVASHLAELGYPESPVIQGVLGHRQRTVTGRYVHAAKSLFQGAVQAHEEALAAYRDGRSAIIDETPLAAPVRDAAAQGGS